MKYVISGTTGGAKLKSLSAEERSEKSQREAAWETKKAALEARRSVAAQIEEVMSTTDAENQILSALVRELLTDVADLKGVSATEYKLDLTARLSKSKTAPGR